MTDGNFIRKWVYRKFDAAVFMVRGISLEQGFYMVNNWRAPVRKRLKQSISGKGVIILRWRILEFLKGLFQIIICVHQFQYLLSHLRVMSVTYSGNVGDCCTGLGTQTLVLKKHFSRFLFFSCIWTKNMFK